MHVEQREAVRVGAFHDIERHVGRQARRIGQPVDRHGRTGRRFHRDGAVADVPAGQDAAIRRVKPQAVLVAPEPGLDAAGLGEPGVARHQIGVDRVFIRARTDLRKRREGLVMAQQQRAAREAAQLVEMPELLRRLQPRQRGRLVERIGIVQTGIGAEDLPGPVGAAQAEVAGRLADPGEQAVIAVAAAIGVVVAAQGEERRVRQHRAQRRQEVRVALGLRAGIVDVAEMDHDVRTLLREQGRHRPCLVGAGRPVRDQGDAQLGLRRRHHEVADVGMADIGDRPGLAVGPEVADIVDQGAGPERIAGGITQPVLQCLLPSRIAGDQGVQQLETEAGAGRGRTHGAQGRRVGPAAAASRCDEKGGCSGQRVRADIDGTAGSMPRHGSGGGLEQRQDRVAGGQERRRHGPVVIRAAAARGRLEIEMTSSSARRFARPSGRRPSPCAQRLARPAPDRQDVVPGHCT